MKNNKKTVVNAEARILNSMEDGFLRADTNGKIIMANQAIAQMCGYASPEEMIGLPIKTLYANPDKRDQMIKELKEKNKLVNFELELKRKNGTTLWSLNNVKTFYDEKSNLLGTEGLIRDITEIRNTKEKLEHTNKVLANIRNVNKLITTEKEVPKLLQHICEILTDRKGYHNVWIMLLNEHGKFEAVYQTGLGKEFLELANLLKKNKFTSCALKTLEKKDVVSIANPMEDCHDCPLAKHYQNRGAMTAPIIYNNKLYGLITVSVPREYLIKEELDLFKDISDDIGLSLHSIISEAKRLEIEKDLNVANLKLKATNQQLQSSEQQLQASNQQLQAGEQQLQASNQQLRATNQQLQAGEQQLIKNEEELISVNHSLKERIKEITCIFNITSTIIEHDTIDEILSNIVQFLPPAWNYPETTVARIQFQNKIFHSNNFKETQWKQSADIMVDSASQGSIDIFYLTEKPILYEGPFLKEERALIDTLSRIIGKSIENILKKEQV